MIQHRITTCSKEQAGFQNKVKIIEIFNYHSSSKGDYESLQAGNVSSLPLAPQGHRDGTLWAALEHLTPRPHRIQWELTKLQGRLHSAGLVASRCFAEKQPPASTPSISPAECHMKGVPNVGSAREMNPWASPRAMHPGLQIFIQKYNHYFCICPDHSGFSVAPGACSVKPPSDELIPASKHHNQLFLWAKQEIKEDWEEHEKN